MSLSHSSTNRNEACKVLPDDLEDLTTDAWYYFQKSPRRLRQFEEFQSFVECKHTSCYKQAKHDGSALMLV